VHFLIAFHVLTQQQLIKYPASLKPFHNGVNFFLEKYSNFHSPAFSQKYLWFIILKIEEKSRENKISLKNKIIFIMDFTPLYPFH
jgi:hypothetical protein